MENCAFNLEKILNDLAEKRPVFHSEADFQFSLATKIKECVEEAEVYLEFYHVHTDKNDNLTPMYIDIVVVIGDKYYPIELKYKTKSITWADSFGTYTTKEQSAQDFGCYDFIKDITRIEILKNEGIHGIKQEYSFGCGYAIMLTNDPLYWKGSRGRANYQSFKIPCGRILSGQLSWIDAEKDYLKERRTELRLDGTYNLSWINYSSGENSLPNSLFKFLVVSVPNLQ